MYVYFFHFVIGLPSIEICYCLQGFSWSMLPRFIDTCIAVKGDATLTSNSVSILIAKVGHYLNGCVIIWNGADVFTHTNPCNNNSLNVFSIIDRATLTLAANTNFYLEWGLKYNWQWTSAGVSSKNTVSNSTYVETGKRIFIN